MSTPTAPQADTPGDSAQREYERRKAASVKTSLDKTLADLARASSSERQAIRAWADGAEGERKLGAVLKALPGLRVVSDCSVGGANLDFIVIGRSGVFVVDAKHYTGVITFRDDGDSSAPHLRLYVDGWDRSYLADEMWWQVKRVRRALATKLKPVPFVTPVLCFVDGTWSIPLPPVDFKGVRLVSERSIRNLVADKRILDAAAVERIHDAVMLAFRPK